MCVHNFPRLVCDNYVYIFNCVGMGCETYLGEKQHLEFSQCFKITYGRVTLYFGPASREAMSFKVFLTVHRHVQ